ncbi:potassium voltage-gated channel subfamily KQT member 1-like protein [Labeo rohita]|uniref:Potassium voltage-gated channel subfamily KQT member 1-like protein n=1 Tax=Labeo rohita TaxID=84645 RepID=A0A498NSB2_LABRO|nr:potassium voltage-gated channel subfamily KQT member 1-like protein [Labeo rohita]
MSEWLRYESWCQGYDNQADIRTSGQPGYRAEKQRGKPIAMVLHGAESSTSTQGVSQGEKGVDKEYYTVGARLIRLEDKVLQMDVKLENVLKILMEHFQPKPELLQKPNQYSSRVTVMKRLGVSMDESQ